MDWERQTQAKLRKARRDLQDSARQAFMRKAQNKVKRRNQHADMMREARASYERNRQR